ncbi:MAG: zinc metallopeptidase [Ruminococcus sp.]|nr:zinc metallopeptidase [Ruminococcus sp.]
MDIILLLIIILLPLLAQLNVTATFKKYSKVANSRGLTGEQVARRILDANGLYSTRIEHISGNLTDHYDPTENVVRLSDSVYDKTSVAALGVAAHECGHVCQHAESYTPIVIRSKIVPAVNICSRFWYFVFLIGVLVFQAFPALVYIGIIMFAAVVVFQLVTLPTELNASSRALQTLENDSILESSEIPAARKVLTAAAMTYIVGLVTSILQLLRLLRMVNRR